MLDGLGRTQPAAATRRIGDPEIETRIAQYEMAFRMQTSVPELTDLSGEPRPSARRSTGRTSRKPGTFAANCLLARRLVERGVRFVQLYHRGWDQHGNLPTNIPKQCQDVDQPSGRAGADLKQRGLLDDTLVIWGGEFGRTVYGQGGTAATTTAATITAAASRIWMAGGGIKPGIVYGETDDFGYNIVERPGPRPRPQRHDARTASASTTSG